MRQLIVKQLDYDLTPVAGLALVGQYLKAVQPVLGRLDTALPVKGGVANSDIVRSCLGLLVQGKVRIQPGWDAMPLRRLHPTRRRQLTA